MDIKSKSEKLKAWYCKPLQVSQGDHYTVKVLLFLFMFASYLETFSPVLLVALTLGVVAAFKGGRAGKGSSDG